MWSGGCYERGFTGSMAEDGTELEALETQLHLLLGGEPPRGDSRRFCSHFCTLVEQHASRWQLPLPQLRILQVALCYFSRASAGFTSDCDHVLDTVSSLALSIFELLLFFDQKDFEQEPLQQFSVTFQECHSVLSKLQNVHLLQVERAVRQGGPWSSPALQAILRESSLPQDEVDGCIGSELPVFFELRVHYLLSRRRVAEAMALARCCARHPAAGQHAFFLQVYLTWLYKTSQLDRLHSELAVFNGKDAVHIICSLECEEEDKLLLALCTAFLSQQLRRGDLYYLCELLFVWTKLHSRLKTPTRALLAESHQLMLSATNINSIFPFIRAILQETGQAGIQFCVELCANALQSCLPCDVATKTLIYKTIAGLLPNDLEVCRACALLIFFLERTVESYKMVYLLYLHPDQEYHVDCCPVGNHVRFEMLQILKKDMCFDPEFWNLIALRTSCLKLMREKVVSAALEELMEDKWISNYCTKELALRSATSSCRRERTRSFQGAEKRRHHKDNDANATSKRPKVEHAVKKRGCQASRLLRGASSEPLRRSFWQLDRLRDNGEHRRTTRLSEKSTQKRRIRTPRWLLEDSGTLENNVPLKMKKHGLREQKQHRPSVINRSQSVPFKNNIRHKNLEGKAKENGVKHQKGFLSDGLKVAPAPQVVLELSLPDNELLFTEDACSRQRGLPQVLFYRSTIKLPEASQPTKTPHGKEVILRARDAAMFVQQLHCYARKQKGKGIGPNAHGSVSTITRSSVQGSPPKDPPPEPCSRPEAKDGESLQIPAVQPVLQKLSSVRDVSEKSTEDGTRVLNPDCEEPAVEMKVTFASQSPVLEKVCKAGEREVSPSSVGHESPPVLDQVTNTADSEEMAPKNGEGEQKSPSSQPERTVHLSQITSREDSEDPSGPTTDHNDVSALTQVAEVIQELPPQPLSEEPENNKHPDSGNCASEESKSSHKVPSTSSFSVSNPEGFLVDGQGSTQDSRPCFPEDEEQVDSEPETEESKLEYCCTFCNKDFKGRRVVEHAMFHYRRDECMFCGLIFRDDLLAMMHLSDHIEKLKRLKDTPGNKVKAKGFSDTKDTSTAKTSAKAQPNTVSSGRPRKSTGCSKPSKPHSLPNFKRSQSRTLRSNNKLADEKQVAPKPTVHKLNGHTGRRKDLKRLKHNLKAKISQEIKSDGATNHRLRKHKDVAPSAPQLKKSFEDPGESSPSPQVLKTNTKQNRSTDEDKTVAPEERVRCQVDGCSWSTDLSKNRVTLLYHALEEHHGDVEPLKLAFSKGNGKCSICMRVLWSFEHFRHHVERHRLTPRHPCLHQGCSARFKTGMEMRRHTRKHSPLQAACCLPGCSRLFICLWALNLHEREHYARKSRDITVKDVDGHDDTTGKNQLNSKHTSSAGTQRQQAERANHHPPRDKPAARVPKEDQSTNSNVLKNLSNKDASTETAAPHVRLRLRKATNTPPKVHKVISALMKRCRTVRHKLKKKQVNVETGPKKRGRPPKIKRDENTDGLREAVTHKNRMTSPQPPPPKVALSGKEKEDETRNQNQVPGPPAQTPTGECKVRPSVKRSHVEEKLVVSSSSQRSVTAPEHKPPKTNAARRKPHAKSHKGALGKVHRNHRVSSTLAKCVKTTSTILQPESKASRAAVEESSEEGEQTEPGDSELPVLPATTDKPHSQHSEDKHKKVPLPTTEKPQSLKSEDKQKKVPVPQTTQNLQSEEKHITIPVSPTITQNNKTLQSEEEPNKLPVPPTTTEKPQSLQSEEEPEKVPVSTTEKPQSLKSEHKVQVPPPTHSPQSDDKHATLPVSPTTTQNNQSPQSAKKPKKCPVLPTTQKPKKPKKLSVPPTTTEKPKKPSVPPTTAEKPKKAKKLCVPPTIQKSKSLQSEGKPKRPQKKKENPTSDTKKNENLNEKAAKKAAKGKRPCKPSVPSKCEVKQEDGAGGGAAEWRPPKEGGTSAGSQETSINSKAVKKSHPSKARKKCKVLDEDDRVAAKKRRKESKKPSECECGPQVLQEGGAAESPPAEGPPPLTPVVRGRATSDRNFSVCKETLEKYSKKPYLRLPPTVYLDEKYTTMPKRRKEASPSSSSPRSSPPEPQAFPLPLQRHRCSNCFTTFHCDQELQRHLTLNKCSAFFGFDSDNDD